MAFRSDEEAQRARLQALERRAAEADALARRLRELEAENLTLRRRLERLEQEPRRRAAPRATTVAGRSAGRYVLVVDADNAFIEQLRSFLEGRGVGLTASTDGAGAMQQAKASPPPALIVLCAELPEANGYAICQKLKKDARTNQIPLVLCSAEANEQLFLQHQKLRTRADGYLLKPCSTEALAVVLDPWIREP